MIIRGPGTGSVLTPKAAPRSDDRLPARGRQAVAPTSSWPRPAAWARAVTRKRSGSSSGVSAGRMAADTQVRRAAAGPMRPATGRGRRPPAGPFVSLAQGSPGSRRRRAQPRSPLGLAPHGSGSGSAPGPGGADPTRTRGVRGSGLGLGSWTPAGPLPDPEVAAALLSGTPLRFSDAPGSEPGQCQLFLKLSIRQVFPEHLLCAGTSA